MEKLMDVVTTTKDKKDIPELHKLKQRFEKEAGAKPTFNNLAEAKLEQVWNSAFYSILNDPETELKIMGGKRVYTIGPSAFLQKTLALKRSKDLQELQDERALLDRIEHHFHEENYPHTPEALNIVTYRGQPYLISRMEEGIQLTELDLKTQEDTYKKIAESLALIHNTMTSDKGARDMLATIASRAKDDDLQQYLQHHLPTAFSRIEQDYVFDKDPHERNWGVTPTGTIIAYDWNDKGMTLRDFELVKLKENTMLNRNHHKEVDDTYFKKRRISPKNFTESYDNALIGVAINTKLVNPEDPRNHHLLQRAGKTANEYKHRSAGQARKDYEALENIISHLARS